MMSFRAAVLSGGLLARKGAAMPTGFTGVSTLPRAVSDGAARAAPAGAPPSGGRHDRKVSLRLDAERHRKLRLAAVHLGRSGQRILLDALDAHLARCAETIPAGDCACLQRKPGQAR
jgi:hypothetical protein